MLGGGGVRVKAVFALVLLAGCFWRTYGRLAATHVDLLVAMARKGTDLVASGRLSAESMPELTYPLERAEAFVHDARARSGTPPASLDALDTLCARYRAFVDALDRVRRERRGEAARAALADPLAAVEAAAEGVRAELRAESRAAAGVPGRAPQPPHLAAGRVRSDRAASVDQCALRRLYRLFAFFQSARKRSSPTSLSGCFTSCWRTANGQVAMCAPICAARMTWNGLRTLATSTSAGYV